jgi:crotonobetainyl-CoA:carnitine CoA-transferase CaiB-like acyl-CoA transferase
MMQPLDDIRVLDLSRVYAAPAGAMTLGDLGADVIRVEPPIGQYERLGAIRQRGKHLLYECKPQQAVGYD